MVRTLRRILFGGSAPSSWVADLGLTALRVGAGLTMVLAHGRGKLPPPEQFIQGVTHMGFPLPVLFAWLAALAESGGALAVALGLATRVGAFFVLVNMSVAFFVFHAADPFGEKELAFVYGLVMLAFVLAGAGRYSVDRVLRG